MRLLHLHTSCATLLGWLLCAACESDLSSPVPPGNRPPIIRSATIDPDPVLLSGPAVVQVQVEDPDHDPVTFRFQWYADDYQLEGQTESKLDTEYVKRDMRVWVEVVASDGRADSPAYRTTPVLVANTLPEVSNVTAENPDLKAGDRVKLKVEGFDADDDSLEYTYRWWRNTDLVSEGDQPELDTTGFARGDTVVVEVTPHDRTGAGRPSMSDPIIIGNTPPSITSTPPSRVFQGRYEYRVTAVDADKDALSYALEKAPAGMTIDKGTGLIQWQLSAGMTGPYHVRVLVEDGQKGHAFQEFDLSPAKGPSS